MSMDPSRVALLHTMRKEGDLVPPLGHPGGRCHVIERIRDNVQSPVVREDLIEQIEFADEIDVQESSRVYRIEAEKGIEGTRFTSLVILPHAQYRMDLRGISVPELRASIRSFWDHYSILKSRGQAKPLEQDMAFHGIIRWDDPRLGITLVFKVFDREVRVITVFQTGVSDPRPIAESSCRVAGGSRTLYHIGKRPARPVPGRHGPWKRPWLKEPVLEAVFLTDNPAEVWRIDKNSNVSIRDGNLYAYEVPEWVIKAAGGLHRWEGNTDGVSIVKEILVTPDLWEHVTFKGGVPPSRWTKEKYSLPQTMSQKTRFVGWREYDKVPRWRGLLTTGKPEYALQLMSEKEKTRMEKEILSYMDELKVIIAKSRNRSEAGEKKLRENLSEEERKSLLSVLSRDSYYRLDLGNKVTEAQKALDILQGVRPDVAEEADEAWDKVVRWPNPWVRAHPEEEILQFGSYRVLTRPWERGELKYSHPVGVYGEVKPGQLPKRPEDLLPFFEREKRRLPGKLLREKWVPLSPSLGKDYLQVSMYQDLMHRAAGFCPLRSEMYGGLPSSGGFDSIKELGVGLANTFEAAHCILGSLGRHLNGSDWVSMVRTESGHLQEEAGLIEKFVREYSRDIYIKQMTDFSDYKLEYRERAQQGAQKQVEDILQAAPRLQERALKMRDALSREELPEPVFLLADATYHLVYDLCKSALESVRNWPQELENPFVDQRVKMGALRIQRRLDELLAWGRKQREEALTRSLVGAARGDCYQANGKYFLDNAVFKNNSGMKIVHGEVTGQGPLEGINYGHCWVEDGDTVIDVSNGNNIRMPKALYHRLGRIAENNNIKKYSWNEFQMNIVTKEHWGPWDLKTSTGL